MPWLTIDPSGTHVRRNGRPFPLIVDTAWSSFADPTPDEWRTYLAARREQGFTSVFVTALPIVHDRDQRPTAREPFVLDADGQPDHRTLDDGFFATAREYLRIAHEEYGIVLIIVVLWNNYLPGTWGAAATPETVLTDETRRQLVRRVAETFGDLEPIFCVGGDDHYDVPQANAGYREAARILRDLAPGCLLTTHSAPNATLPADIADLLDLHLHQSGHNVENQELTWRQPAQYLARRPRKPLLASEPPYEQHGKINGHGRWSREEVRRASWTSVLAGATAGIGYGAHGMWMWHTPSGEFRARDSSLEPVNWPAALAFPGAKDISLLARLFEDHGFERLSPAQELLVDTAGDAIRLATSGDRRLVVLYQPFCRDVRLRLDLSGYRVIGWDLAERAPVVPSYFVHNEQTTFRQLSTVADQLIVAERRG